MLCSIYAFSFLLANLVSPPFMVVDLLQEDLSDGTEEGKDFGQSEGEHQAPDPSNLENT